MITFLIVMGVIALALFVGGILRLTKSDYPEALYTEEKTSEDSEKNH